MNYLKIYIQLVKHSKRREQIDGYYEKHHVFPVSIFGYNVLTVKLTAREHYIAHALLEKIYTKRYGTHDIRTKKMVRAFFMMNNAHGNGQQRYTNSRLFESSKIRFSEQMRGENSPFYGKKRVFSEQHLENMKSSRKFGEEHPLYGIPRSEEIVAKMKGPKRTGHGDAVSKARKGMKFTEDHKKNLSVSHKGQIPHNKGKSKYMIEIIDPCGNIVVTNNLNYYCISHGLTNKSSCSSLLRVAKGIRQHHKGYTAKIISEIIH